MICKSQLDKVYKMFPAAVNIDVTDWHSRFKLFLILKS